MENTIELNFIPVTPDYEKLPQLRQLYLASFPEYERKPFDMIEGGIQTGKMEGFAIEKGNQLCGLAFVIFGQTVHVLDYLAVDPEFQNQNIGSRILQRLKDRYDRPYLVEIESTVVDPSSEKLRRKAFYLRNGMILSEDTIRLFGVDMELLSTCREVSYDEYLRTMQNYFDFNAEQFVQKTE